MPKVSVLPVLHRQYDDEAPAERDVRDVEGA
jgi:hypothetical protein